MGRVFFENNGTEPRYTCAVLWYPQSGSTEFSIDERVFNLFQATTEYPYTESTLLGAIQEGEVKTRDCCRIEIQLTKDEHNAILKDLEQVGRSWYRTCSGSVASLLEKHIGIKTPFLKGIWPSRFGNHLWKQRLKEDSRITKVEYFNWEKVPQFETVLSRGRLPDVVKTLAVLLVIPMLLYALFRLSSEAIKGLIQLAHKALTFIHPRERSTPLLS